MNQRNFSFAGLLTGFVALVLGFSSCKEDIIIKSNLTPSTDNIGTDTFLIPADYIIAKTVQDDTLQTSTRSATYNVYHALGWLKEPAETSLPYPSTTQGDVIFQIVPKSTGFAFTGGDIIDSVVIVMPYSGFSWGDTTVTDAQTIKAYELSDTLTNNSRYFTTTVKTPKSEEIGSVTFNTGRLGTGVIGDSVVLVKSRSKNSTQKVGPHLRIKLSNAFKERFDTLVGKHYSTHDSFLNNLRGFMLKPDVNKAGKAMPYFRINGGSDNYGQTNLLVYAHNGGNDSIVYQFPFNTTYTAHYNYIKRTYSNPALFNNKDFPELMVQNQPGAAIDLTITNLRDFEALKGNIVINKVEFVLTEVAEYAQTVKYTRPIRTYPLGIDGANVKYGILDRLDNGSASDAGLSFINGTPFTNTATNTTTYPINFPREFQQSMIQQKSELHLRINGTQTFPAAYRLVAGNRSHPNAKYRYALRVVYSKQN